MKNHFKTYRLYALFTFVLLAISIRASSQIIVNSASLTYQQNFNMLDTTSANSSNLPLGWFIIEYGNSSTVNNQYKGNSGTSATGDVYSYGSPGSAERALGSLATSGNRGSFGALFKNNTGTTISSISTSYRGEQWRRGTCISDTLFFRYSHTATSLSDTAAAAWTSIPSLSLVSPYSGSPNSTALEGNASGNHVSVSDTIPVNIPPGDSLWIAWFDKDATGSDDGLAIDDVSITFITTGVPVPENIYLICKSPSGDSIAPGLSSLSMHFDRQVEQGNGQITLHNENGVVTVFQLPSPLITVTDSTATLHDILLENNSRYYVLMAAGAFVKAGTNIPNQSITDTTFWAFTTADTVVIRPLTTLHESFESCPDTPLGIFKPYNSLGFKTWKCATGGHTGTTSASMSGGITDDISDNNEDWLISQSAFDFSAMSKPELSFWQKKRFEGVVGRSLRIATDYIPGSNPVLATWTVLQVQDMIDEPSEDWTPIADIDLSPYKNTPFYIAFTYSCGRQGAYELDYDDIKVEDEALGIADAERSGLQLSVAGQATAACINLWVTTTSDAVSTVDIYTMSGRKVFTTPLKTTTGKGLYPILNTSIPPGLYLLRLYNRYDSGVVRVTIF